MEEVLLEKTEDDGIQPSIILNDFKNQKLIYKMLVF